MEAIHLAALHGRAEALRALLDAGADPRAKTPGGKEPLHFAAESGEECARLLLAAGADPDAKSAAGWPPLHFAAQAGRAECARLLVAGAIADPEGPASHCPPLRLASGRGERECARLLLEAGADPNAGEKSALLECVRGAMGLRFAPWELEESYREIAKRLLEAGADPDAAGEDGWAPLHCAAGGEGGGAGAMARILLEGGADPERKGGRHGWTPLRVAAENQSVEAAAELLRRGARDGEIAEDGGSPSSAARRWGNPALDEAFGNRGRKPGEGKRGSREPAGTRKPRG